MGFELRNIPPADYVVKKVGSKYIGYNGKTKNQISASTAAHTVINALITAATDGLILIVDDITLTDQITGAEGIILDFTGHTITPDSSFNMFSFRSGFCIRNAAIDLTGITMNDTVFEFDGAYTINHDDYPTALQNIYIDSSGYNGTGLHLWGEASGENCSFINFDNIMGRGLEYFVLIESKTAAGTAFISGNNFNNLRWRSCTYGLYLDRSGGGTNYIEGNQFINYQNQCGGSTDSSIFCDGNLNLFIGFTWDFSAASGADSHIIQGNYNYIHDYIDDWAELNDTGTENYYINRKDQEHKTSKLTYDSGLTLETSSSYLTLNAGGNALRLASSASTDIWCFSSSGSGENRYLYIYGRNAADTGTAAAWMRTGNGSDDNFRINAASGDLMLLADSNVRFGTHSSLSGETVTGYITIKDEGGTTRKLAVVS